ncbi:MAG: hypothetical protein LUI02_02180 [Clostridiales bacterium]|nr:hypothetical protein [Clostridiales bacterium]
MKRYEESKTSRSEEYTYSSVVKGDEVTFTEETVGSYWFNTIKEMDREENNADRRERRHAPLHYDACLSEDGEYGSDSNPFLADPRGNILDRILDAIAEDEREDLKRRLGKAVDGLDARQVKLLVNKFVLGKTNVAIAAEEGVSETAVRKRLQNVLKALRKKI